MSDRTPRALALVLVAALVAGGLALLGCNQGPPPPQPTVEQPSSSSQPSQGELTRQMEATAAAAARQLEEAQKRTASEEDAIKAYEEFERQRRELNQMAEPVEPPPQ